FSKKQMDDRNSEILRPRYSLWEIGFELKPI
ncbi:MAG: hypothetical protein ACI9LS_001877, partial [Flavobacteriales bacterium]